jgi:tetratricopeptide (TPR) repeat protein
MTKTVINKPCIILALLMLHVPTLATGATQSQQERTTIYLPDVKAIEPSQPNPGVGELCRLATDLLNYQFKALKGAQVIRNEKPACTPVQAQSASSQPSPSQTPAQVTATSDGEYYEVSAVIDPQPKNTEGQMLLTYELTKYVKCASRSIIRLQEPITEKTALQSLKQMGDVLELALKDELAPAKTIVVVSEVTEGSEDLQQVKQKLVEDIVRQLGTLEDITARDARREDQGNTPPDFTVTGAIVTTQNRRGVRLIVKSSKANSQGQPTRVFPIPQNANETRWEEFYQSAATEVVNLVKSVRVAEALKRPSVDLKNPTAIKGAWDEAQRLMCRIGTSPNCVPQYATALPILSALAEIKQKQDWTPQLLELLGYARSLNEENLGAAQAYDEAWKAENNTSNKISLLKKAAEAWYQAKSYEAAADRFGQVIRLSSEPGKTDLPAVYLQWAQSLIFANDRIKALEALLMGLRANPEKPADDPLDDKFDDLWKDLKGAEVIKAAPLMEQYKDLPSVAKERQSFQKKLIEELLKVAEVTHAEGNFGAMDEALRQLEGIPPADLSEPQRNEVLRLRKLWQNRSVNKNAPL